MFHATQAKEVLVKTTSWVGGFRGVAKVVAEKGIDIKAMSYHAHDITGVVRLVTDDTLRTVEALRAHKFDVRELDVIQVEVAHRPGLLRSLTLALEDVEIDVKNLYASATSDSDRCLIILDTTNNQRALVELNRMAVAIN